MANICDKLIPRCYKEELTIQLTIAWPIVLATILQNAMLAVSLGFCGHMNKELMNGASLANNLVFSSGNAVMVGLATTCDTLFSQYFGSKNKCQVGTILQQSIIIQILCCMPMGAILINAEYIFLLLGQNADVARFGGIYSSLYAAGLPNLSYLTTGSVEGRSRLLRAYTTSIGVIDSPFSRTCQAVVTVLSRYLQCQGIVHPSLAIFLCGNICNIGLHMLFFKLDFGIVGAGISISLSLWILMLLHIAYIIVSKVYTNTWTGWSRKCLFDWWKFFSLGVPGVIMICLESWNYTILVFVAGLLGIVPLASYSIANTFSFLNFMAPFGLAVASSVRVGNSLGENNMTKARTAAWVTICLAGSFSVLSSIFFLSSSSVLPRMFTSDRDVMSLSSILFQHLALLVLVDSTQVALVGVIRGMGRQRFGAIVNLFALYFITLPVAILIVFTTDLGMSGAYWGMTAGSSVQMVTYLVKIFTTDWELECKHAQIRCGVIEEINTDDEDNPSYVPDSDVCPVSESSELTKSAVNTSQNLVRTVANKSLIAGIFFITFAVGLILRIVLDNTKNQHMNITCQTHSNGTLAVTNLTFQCG